MPHGGALVCTAKVELPVEQGGQFDLRRQHRAVLLDVVPCVVASCQGLIGRWHASRHVGEAYRCIGNRLISQHTNEIWLQCLPSEGLTSELIVGLKHEMESACSAVGLGRVRVRSETADEVVVFDHVLPSLGGIAKMSELWNHVQEASELAIRDLRSGNRSGPGTNWCEWASHIYDNILGAAEPSG